MKQQLKNVLYGVTESCNHIQNPNSITSYTLLRISVTCNTFIFKKRNTKNAVFTRNNDSKLLKVIVVTLFFKTLIYNNIYFLFLHPRNLFIYRGIKSIYFLYINRLKTKRNNVYKMILQYLKNPLFVRLNTTSNTLKKV